MHKLSAATALALACISAHAARPGCEKWAVPAGVSASAVEATSSHAYQLSLHMRAAFQSGKPASARPAAVEYLASVNAIPCDWNYGNAIHNANSVLGLLALQDGNKAAAVAYLRAASLSPGSPQLDSFGPSLVLPLKLAKAGEYEAVAEYLQRIGTFWKPKDSRPFVYVLPFLRDPDPLKTWLTDLREHEVPNFGMNAHIPP